MDRLKQIESFVAVATRGSLTAAAKADAVAPAVIGRRIDALEARLGVKLLVRTTRRITLTHEGSAYLEDCQRILADLASAEASVSEGGVKASGHLRVTAPAGFGRRHVAPLVPRFLAQHPEVYKTIESHVDQVNRDLASEELMAGSQIRRFLVLHKELDADDGELTRTQKVRRSFIAERYSPLIDALYDGSKEKHIETEVVFEDGRKGRIAATVEIRDMKEHPPSFVAEGMKEAAE